MLLQLFPGIKPYLQTPRHHSDGDPWKRDATQARTATSHCSTVSTSLSVSHRSKRSPYTSSSSSSSFFSSSSGSSAAIALIVSGFFSCTRCSSGATFLAARASPRLAHKEWFQVKLVMVSGWFQRGS